MVAQDSQFGARQPRRNNSTHHSNIVLLKCNTKYGSNMEDYQVRCTVAAMLYVGGQVKSYEEAMKIADSMLNASKQYQG